MIGFFTFFFFAALGNNSVLADLHTLPVPGMTAQSVTVVADQISASDLWIGTSRILAAFDAEPGSQNIQKRAVELCKAIGYPYFHAYGLTSFRTSTIPTLLEVRDGVVHFPKTYTTRTETACGRGCSATVYSYSYSVFESIQCAHTPLRGSR